MKTLLLSSLSALFLATLPGAQKAVRVVPEDDPNATVTEFTFPELGVAVKDVRRVLPDGRIERVGYDAKGQVVDVDALRREDHGLEIARFGKIDSTLRERLEGLQPGDPIEVGFWLLEPDDGFQAGRWISERTKDVPEELIADTVRSLRVQALALNEARLKPGVDTFADAVRAAGGETVTEGLGWPLVIATVPAGSVPDLAAHPLVDTAYVSQPAWEPEGNNAQGTMRTYNVHDLRIFADASVRVMVNDVGAIAPNNPYLPPITVVTTDSVSSHATSVAGNICNDHPLYKAAAFSLPTIYDGPGTGDGVAQSVWSAGLAQGIDFGNCSWWNFLKGKIEMLDRFFDYTIRNFSVMMFKSNGNQGGTSTPFGTTPGQGYNMTCSGNYNDGDNDDWGDDFMTSSSSWWNPQEGHEKPEVASPGDCVATTSGGSTTSCFGGTSSASPLTCGVATLIASYDNTLLAQMTTVKAMLMVSAWHNVEAEALLSDKDGAGGTHAKAAFSLIRDQQWWYQDVVDSDFPGDVLDVTVPLVAGDETRLIALWFSSANVESTLDVLEMDLDMTILDPGGGTVAFSASAVNPFELVSFTPAVSGNYTVRLTKQRFDGTSEPLTIAWCTKNDAGTAAVFHDLTGDPFAVGANPTFLLKEQYDGGFKDYAAFAALSDVSAGPLPGGYAIPIAFDGISNFVIGLPGWLGQFPASGETSTTIALPALPAIAGIDVYFAMVMYPTGALGGPEVLTVSDPLKLTIDP